MNGIEALRRLEPLRQWLGEVDGILGQLTPEDRLILQKLVLETGKENKLQLCELLQVEERTLYRKRERLLKKLQKLPEMPISN